INAGPATVTVAPGSTAPDVSAAFPKISPVCCCAKALVTPSMSNNADATSVFLNVISNPPKTPGPNFRQRSKRTTPTYRRFGPTPQVRPLRLCCAPQLQSCAPQGAAFVPLREVP